MGFSILAGLMLPCMLHSGPLTQLSQRTLGSDELQQDLEILRLTFERAHAGLYRYTPKDVLDAEFDRLESELGKPRTELEFYRLLAPLVDSVHDAHTTLKPSRGILEYLGKRARVFPLDVRFVAGRAFVERNLGPEASIPLAAEILSINGHPIAQITAAVLRARSADGFNTAPKYEVANVNFWLQYFELVDESETFEIEVLDSDAKSVRHFSTPGVAASVVAGGQFEVPSRRAFALEFFDQGRIALMSIPALDDLALRARFSEAFAAIDARRTPTLILDLRNNGGGYDELNTELLSYLIPRPFRFYRRFTFRASSWDDLQHVEYAPDDFWNTADLEHLSEQERKDRLHEMTLGAALDSNVRGNPAAGLHQPSPEHAFRGELLVLVNGRSASSGGEIPALLHFQGIGTLIGEEPNAAYQGVTAGIVLSLTLPNSGIVTSLPLVAYENAVLPGLFVGRGAPPHFVVGESVEDAIAGRDTVLEFALDLIRSRHASD